MKTKEEGAAWLRERGWIFVNGRGWVDPNAEPITEKQATTKQGDKA